MTNLVSSSHRSVPKHTGQVSMCAKSLRNSCPDSGSVWLVLLVRATLICPEGGPSEGDRLLLTDITRTISTKDARIAWV